MSGDLQTQEYLMNETHSCLETEILELSWSDKIYSKERWYTQCYVLRPGMESLGTTHRNEQSTSENTLSQLKITPGYTQAGLYGKYVL